MTTTNTSASTSYTLSNSQKKRHLKARKSVKIHNTTPFRQCERYYKSRVPEPSYDLVLDLASGANTERYDVQKITLRNPLSSKSCLYGKYDYAHAQKAYIIRSHPGFILIPNAFTAEAQKNVVKYCLGQARGPNITNLDTHYNVPEEGIWKVFSEWYAEGRKRGVDETLVDTKAAKKHPRALSEEVPQETEITASTAKAVPTNEGGRKQINLPPMIPSLLDAALNTEKPPAPPALTLSPEPVSSLVRKLRWTTIGLQYHWPTKSYYWDQLHDETYKLPSDFFNIATAVVQAVPWNEVFAHQESPPDYSTWAATYNPTAGIINHYQANNDTLMAHVDQSEADSVRPLVSYSVGHSAIFLLGAQTRDVAPIPIMLHSGDVLIMSGETRRAFHGVPRILENEPEDLGWSEKEDCYRQYMKGSRINVNIRQVV